MKTSKIEINSSELSNLHYWIDSNEHLLPSNIQTTIRNLTKLHSIILNTDTGKKDLLRLIHRLMKITPSSEKGSNGLK